MVEVQSRGIEAARERIQQVGAMNEIVRRAVTGCRRWPELQRLAGLHVAGLNAFRSVAHGGEFLANPDAAKRFHRLAADADPGADLAERTRLFEDLDLEAEARQRISGRKAREAAADDRDCSRLRHADNDALYWSLMPVAPITLPQRAVSLATWLPNSATVIGIGTAPRSAKRLFTLGSARTARISLLSLSMI